MRKDQLLYIDVNQMYNRYFKGFTLLSDTEEYPVDRFDPNDNTSWVDPYDQNGDLKPIRDGEDHIKLQLLMKLLQLSMKMKILFQQCLKKKYLMQTELHADIL